MYIVSRLRLFVGLLIVLTAIAVGSAVFLGAERIADERLRQELSERVELEAQRFSNAVHQVELDARFLVGLPAAGLLPVEEKTQLSREQLAMTFLQMVRTRPEYSQVRLLSARGMEVVRVERASGQLFSVPEQALQDKSHRGYFREAARLPDGGTYVFYPTLNREHGQIEVPHRPMLRVTATRREGQQLISVFIINVSLNALQEQVIGPRESNCCHYLMNHDGDYLIHPDVRKTYGFDLGERFFAHQDFPGYREWNEREGDGSLLVQQRDFLVEFRKVFLGTDRYLVVGLKVPTRAVGEDLFSVGGQALILTLVLSLLGVGVAYGVARSLVRPVERITKVAAQISKGSSPDTLPVDQKDEVGMLARAFLHMVQALQAKEQGLSAANERLRRANLDLEHFAQIASHDLREPARRVAHQAEFLLEDEGERLSQEGRDTAERLRRSAKRLLTHITDIRAFTQSGQGVLVRGEVDLGALVDSVLREFSGEVNDRSVIVTRDPLPVVDGYEGLLRIFFTNLVKNALAHTRRDGFELHFSAKTQDNGATVTWPSTSGMHTTGMVFGVRNTGSSIESDAYERVFLPMFRLEDSVGGAGMGLSICKRIIERHAGRIWVESGVDEVHIKFTLGEADAPAEGSN